MKLIFLFIMLGGSFSSFAKDKIINYELSKNQPLANMKVNSITNRKYKIQKKEIINPFFDRSRDSIILSHGSNIKSISLDSLKLIGVLIVNSYPCAFLQEQSGYIYKVKKGDLISRDNLKIIDLNLSSIRLYNNNLGIVSILELINDNK